MNETKHTPGPWESWPHNRARHPVHSYGISAEGGLPCDVADVIDFDGSPGESEANARLIAAAPDLLAACQVFLNAPHDSARRAAKATMSAAIAKATGTEATP